MESGCKLIYKRFLLATNTNRCYSSLCDSEDGLAPTDMADKWKHKAFSPTLRKDLLDVYTDDTFTQLSLHSWNCQLISNNLNRSTIFK